MPTKPPWFKNLFGFDEGASYTQNQKHFAMDGEMLVSPTRAFEPMYVGKFETPCLAELRAMLAAELGGAAGLDGGLRFEHLPDPVGVSSLIANPKNADSVFMAASQFNCLEMVGPGVSPSRGIAIYFDDPTQGPKCALACPAGTVYRNYLCQGGAGQGKRQIDCLAGVGDVLGNGSSAAPKFWAMQNGYALPAGAGSIGALGAKLGGGGAELAAEAEAALRVGVHWSTQVGIKQHRVAQVYASALPIAYANEGGIGDWEPFARLVLRAAYEATLCAAACIGVRERRRVRVVRTALGGGAFGNPTHWIADALRRSLEVHAASPIDVFLVHYGSVVPHEWKGVAPIRADPSADA